MRTSRDPKAGKVKKVLPIIYETESLKSIDKFEIAQSEETINKRRRKTSKNN